MKKLNKPSLASRIALEILDEVPASLQFDYASGPSMAQILDKDFAVKVWRRIRRFSPATLGIIAASGAGARVDANGIPVSEQPTRDAAEYSLYHVHCGTWLGKHWDGTSLLRHIACTAIIAEMANILTKWYCAFNEERKTA